jgi:hypothetical protein
MTRKRCLPATISCDRDIDQLDHALMAAFVIRPLPLHSLQETE